MNETLERWARRIASVTLYASLALLATLGLPVLLPLAGVIDLVRGGTRWATVRCYAFLLVYLICELTGILVSLGLAEMRISTLCPNRLRTTKRRAAEKPASLPRTKLEGFG